MQNLIAAIAALKLDLAGLKQQIVATQNIAVTPPPADDQAYRQAVNDRIDRIMAQLTPDAKNDLREAA